MAIAASAIAPVAKTGRITSDAPMRFVDERAFEDVVGERERAEAGDVRRVRAEERRERIAGEDRDCARRTPAPTSTLPARQRRLRHQKIAQATSANGANVYFVSRPAAVAADAVSTIVVLERDVQRDEESGQRPVDERPARGDRQRRRRHDRRSGQPRLRSPRDRAAWWRSRRSRCRKCDATPPSAAPRSSSGSRSADSMPSGKYECESSGNSIARPSSTHACGTAR